MPGAPELITLEPVNDLQKDPRLADSTVQRFNRLTIQRFNGSTRRTEAKP
jgi:hypothetical protein